VIESITDWAFSWPISRRFVVSVEEQVEGGKPYVDSSLRHFADDSFRCCELCGRSSSRV
jgi:hypothetical protein